MKPKIDNDEIPSLNRDTLLVHAGEGIDSQFGSVAVPVYETASFSHVDFNAHQTASDQPSDRSYYSRGYNPTVRAFENKIAVLENADTALAFGNGMAAISTTLLVLLGSGGHLICTDKVFVTTRRWLDRQGTLLGFSVSYVDTSDMESIRSSARSETRAVYVESLSNPLLDVANLVELVRLCDVLRVSLVVDNTFLSPYLLRPLDFGVDIVLHSATKYISGHGHVLGGVVAGRHELMDRIIEPRRLFGTTLTPHAASLLLSGIKTLGLRITRSSETAVAVATLLSEHPAVKRVYYPGLPEDSGHALALSLTGGPCGGIVSFELVEHEERKHAFYDALHLITRATSLGDCASLCDTIESPDVFRIACGIEATADVCSDLQQALDKAARYIIVNDRDLP
ncbi:MAG TPA: PLP-dependent aspartate aminotransferase family protein [Acidimicrobiales bacterium]|nr:PLP-dependent aspartate aminotransferase family protein [Acidimicrobiales bacterium]